MERKRTSLHHFSTYPKNRERSFPRPVFDNSTNKNLYHHIAITKNASAYIPTIIAVAIQSKTPRIFTVLSSPACFLPIKKATNPKNANMKTIIVIILRKGESISLLSSKIADITDNTGINSIIIAVVRFVIFLAPLLISWPAHRIILKNPDLLG